MKIVLITSESFIYHSYSIIKELRKKTDLTVYIQGKNNTQEITEWCERLNAVFVKRKRLRNPLNFFAELKFIYILRKIDADLVWFDPINLYQILPAKFFLKRFIVSVHDVDFHPETKNYYGILTHKLIFKLLKKNIYVASRTQSALCKERFGFEPSILQLPIIDYYSVVGKSNDEIQKNRSTLRFFYFGSIERYKGIETLIAASEILVKKNVSFELNIYGKSKYDIEELKKSISKIENLKLTDRFIDYKEVSSIYSSNDVLVLPYKQVTQCGPLLVGYAYDVPAICSDLPGFREYVDDGGSGLIFDGTPEDLSQRMLFFINNPEMLDRMRGFIHTEIHKKFSMIYLITPYLDNISKFIDNKHLV